MNSKRFCQLPLFSSWNFDHETTLAYVRNITEILAEYSWIYCTRNTDIFVHNVLEKIPLEWVEAILDLSETDYIQLPYGFTKDNWPVSLKTFILQCTQLAELRFPKCTLQLETIDEKSLTAEKNTPLKKQNEITALSSLIYQICKVVNCRKVLDIGSGLGYIDEFLHHNFGLQCVGLDYKEGKTECAKWRLKEDPCILSMHHETATIKNTEECIEKLKVILKNAHNANPVCKCRSLHFPEDPLDDSEKPAFIMIGLHCCGNLTQDMMKLFCSIKELKAFVCVGCCYNKINLDDFPMSDLAQDIVDSICENYPNWYPCVSGLRLGSHATRSDLKSITPDVLESREKSLIFRGILQCYINQDNVSWRKPKRRVKPRDLVSFEKYCDTMFSKSEQNMPILQRQERRKKLYDIYSSKQELFPRVRVLLILQMLLQPLWECLVLLDRKLFFQEKSIVTEVCAVWEDSISPRNLALCAYKI